MISLASETRLTPNDRSRPQVNVSSFAEASAFNRIWEAWGAGFFSNDCCFSLFVQQGSIGLYVATGDGCPPNGLFADAGLIDSYRRLTSLKLVENLPSGFRIRVPGMFWMPSLGLLAFWLIRSAREAGPEGIGPERGHGSETETKHE